MAGSNGGHLGAGSWMIHLLTNQKFEDFQGWCVQTDQRKINPSIKNPILPWHNQITICQLVWDAFPSQLLHFHQTSRPQHLTKSSFSQTTGIISNKADTEHISLLWDLTCKSETVTCTILSHLRHVRTTGGDGGWGSSCSGISLESH